MPVLLARYRVSDLPTWKAAFEANEQNRLEHGLRVKALYLDGTYANGVIVIYDADDLELAHDFYHSDAQRERMAKSGGLHRPPEFWTGNDFPG